MSDAFQNPSSGTPGAAPAGAVKPGKRRRWIVWTLGAVALAGGLVAATPYLVSSGWMNDVVRGWLRDNVERDVEFTSLRVTWTDGVLIRGLVVHDARPGRPPFLEAPTVVLRAPLLPMLVKHFDVTEFVIDDAVVHVPRDGGAADGKGVVKMRRHRRSRAGRPDATDTAADDPLVLPELHVPVTLRNLTLVFTDAEGHEARRGAITFQGRLSTREEPTTFDLDVPAGAGGNIRLVGTASLFDADGVFLGAEKSSVDATVDVTNVDAKANADLLGIFLPGRPAAGVVDAKVHAVSVGRAASGSVEMRVRGAAIGDAVATRVAQGDDLRVKGRFDVDWPKVRIEGMQIRADGLTADGDLSGAWPALDGRVTIDADLARITASLRSIGADLDTSLAGRAKGDIAFTPSPALGRGTFALDGLRIESRSKKHEPVAIDHADVTFAGKPAGDAFQLDALDVRLAEVSAHAAGTIGNDGTLDLRTTANGQLGGLLERARALGMLPSGFSVRGTLDAAVDVKGRAGATGDGALGFTIGRLVLAEDDARIEVKGAATTSTVDLTASGAGDLGKILGRAQAAGVQGPGLDAISGSFSFEASAKGPVEALVVNVPRFKLDGPFAVDASGGMQPQGDITGNLHVVGKMGDALDLARKVGLAQKFPFLGRDLGLDGTLRADAQITGTAKAPQVPDFTLSVATSALTLDAKGSVAADRSIRATAKATGDVAKLADLAVAAGFVAKLPPVSGRLTVDVEAGGTADAVTVPKFSAVLTDGPATADVRGSMLAGGKIAGSIAADAALADLCRIALDAGWLDRTLTPAGRVTLSGGISGTLDQVVVKSAEMRVSGLVNLTASGSLDETGFVKASASFDGPLQPVLDVAAQWTGGTAARVVGTLAGSVTAEGSKDRLAVRLPNFAVRTGGVTLEANGSRDATGDAIGTANVRGPVADLVAALRAFGVAEDVTATGVLDGTVEGKLAGRRVTGSVIAAIANLDLEKPQVGGAAFREPRAAFSASGIIYDLDTRRLEPVQARVECEGAKVEATLDVQEGPAQAGSVPTRTVHATGSLLFEEAFARNHAELLSNVRFTRVRGPFGFTGDVSQGRAAAAGWTGNADLDIEGLVAPYVDSGRAHAVAKLADGVIVLDPIEGVVNGGPVTGTARIGIAGDAPEHSVDLVGKDVAISGDLAPLVAHASPLFAVGEHGKTGGKAGIDVHLKARGLGSAAIKRSLAGKGTLGLKDAFVESGDWIGMLLSLVGSSGRMDIAPMDVPFEVGNGQVKTGDVAMDAVGLLMHLGGQVGLDGKLDYGLRLKPKQGSSAFDKLKSFLDADGWLPLRLEGKVSKPKLRAPDLKDALLDKLGDLFGGDKKDADKKDTDKPDDTTDDGDKPGGGGKKGRKKKPAPQQPPASEEPPPPPAPRGQEPDPAPPPPPPPTKQEDPPPPPPPGTDEPPPPPPPRSK